MLDEVDEHRLGPLEVVDHDDLGAFGRARLEQPPEGELRLRRRRADDRLGLDPDRDQDLDERPVRDALAVREAPPAKDVGRVAHALEEVRDEARLPDAGRPEEREETARAVGNGILVVAPETLALPLSPDERRLRTAGRGTRRRSSTCEEPKGLDRLRLPFQLKRLDSLDLTASRTSSRVSAPISVSVARGGLLEARRDVDGIAGDERLALAADDDPARVDPDPCLESVLRDRGTHLRCCTHRPESVVLVRDRDPEDRHDRVADELLDGATVTLDDHAEILEVAAHARPRSASGSVDSPSAVDPTRSQKRTVTTLRCSRAAAAAVSGTPQNGQNGNSPGSSFPQAGHADTRAVYGDALRQHCWSRTPTISLSRAREA